MANLDTVDAVKSVLLESQLRQTKFEASLQAHTLVRSVLADELEEEINPSLEWNPERDSQGDLVAPGIKVTCRVSKESRPRLCVNAALVLNIETCFGGSGPGRLTWRKGTACLAELEGATPQTAGA
jgi:hypothetical protein